jgi:peroxiredoxin
MKYTITIFLTALICIGCGRKATYTVNGTLTGIDDGKILLQEYLGQSKYKNIDSAEISDGKFTIKGSVDHPVSVIIGVEDKRSKTSFWLENSIISFNSDVDSMHKAEITGSESYNEYLSYNDYINSYREGSRELYSILNDIRQNGSEEAISRAQIRADSAKKSETMAVINYVKSHPGSFVAASMLKSVTYYLTWQELEAALKAFDPVVASTEDMVALKEKIEVLRKVDIGQKAPDFTMNDPDGVPIRFYDVLAESEVLLLDFWAAWCGPCRKENPFVVATYNQFHSKGFSVLGVSLDKDRESWVKAIEDDKLTWTHVSNVMYWDNPVAKMYGVSAIPTNYLIDKNGIIVGKNLRGIALKDKVSSLIGD